MRGLRLRCWTGNNAHKSHSQTWQSDTKLGRVQPYGYQTADKLVYTQHLLFSGRWSIMTFERALTAPPPPPVPPDLVEETSLLKNLQDIMQVTFPSSGIIMLKYLLVLKYSPLNSIDKKYPSFLLTFSDLKIIQCYRVYDLWLSGNREAGKQISKLGNYSEFSLLRSRLNLPGRALYNVGPGCYTFICDNHGGQLGPST